MSQELVEPFRGAGALLEGHFLLASGLHSPRYLQCARVLMDPVAATRLGGALAGALGPVLREPPGAVVAPALGGVIVAHEVARGLGCRALFTERQDGRMTPPPRLSVLPWGSLLELEAPTYTADACPLCARGSKPEKPGSRA